METGVGAVLRGARRWLVRPVAAGAACVAWGVGALALGGMAGVAQAATVSPTVAGVMVVSTAAPSLVAPDPVLSPFSGQGNVTVFDAAAGSLGWVGSVDGLLDPASGDTVPLVSVVLASFDRMTQALSGTFELTASADLASTLIGRLSGTATDPDILLTGGQFSLDYLIDSGTGRFAGLTGFGLSFLDFNPLATGDNHVESGLFVTSAAAVSAVPEPAGGVLVGTALCALVAFGRRRAQQPCQAAVLPVGRSLRLRGLG